MIAKRDIVTSILEGGCSLMCTQKIQKLQEMIKNSRNIVFFGGAGVSTESGIRIFGVWTGSIMKHGNFRPKPF
jgi:NAD-dependent deacetylase